MVHAEPVGEQTILRLDHVHVAVVRKLRVHAVTWLARFAVTDAIRHDDEKLHRAKRLARAEKFAGKFRPDELPAAAGGAVGNQNRIAHDAFVVFHRFAKRPVMDLQFRQRFARGEFEIANDVIAFRRRQIFGGAKNRRRDK